ncbi:M16 family metallopeptidase [Biformimicrobium ophioploci]|uniref:Pitrilysin family protein n=1 Tax=Biformimicrobium ophioploci TaxID=3036711 RepID=A0ABQ6M2I7_9GAMM|nr:pitrilysin family protein [Microbulbifer sp. NKW57]GMG88512.1 pitrilysin family protein [Microbulbifer sp. NKW57]
MPERSTVKALKFSPLLFLVVSFLVACTDRAVETEPAAEPVRSEKPPVEARDNPAFVPPPDIEIPFYKSQLDNGLTVIVHEDHKAPVVAINIWYRVGSKDETPGKTGFAHLFEHLMFNGSENYPGEYFEPFQRAGATGMNGTTNNDRTNYFETVPVGALDMALWMESDRMGHFAGAISQEKLDEQRGVVKNEKRQGENRPYGKAWESIARATFPPQHPYSWPVIGSMEDLDNASLEDVKQWFKEYYAPANAILVFAGDITAEKAMEKAQYYFGDIPSPSVPPVLKRWELPQTVAKHEQIFDEVPQTRIYKVWNTPAIGSADEHVLDILAPLLGNRKNSLLYRELVFEKRLATGVSAFYFGRQLAGQFIVMIDVKPGVEPALVEAQVDRLMAQFRAEGASAAELRRIKQGEFSELVKGLEKVGGFGGKSDLLARSEFFYGDPGILLDSIEQYAAITPEDVNRVVRKWLPADSYTLHVSPRGEFKAADKGADRSSVPEVDKEVHLELPQQNPFALDNGLQVVLVERHDTPAVFMQMQFPGGGATDGDKPGLASMVAAMQSEGAGDYDSLAFSNREEELGAAIGAGSALDYNTLSMTALTNLLDDSVALFADVILRPRFDEKDLERLRSNWLDKIAQEQAQPRGLALRALPPLLFGEGHPYSAPLTGSGTVAGVSAITTEDIARFHKAHVRPDNARLVVVGDITREDLQPLLEKHLGGWKAPAGAGDTAAVAEVRRPDKTTIYLMDKPGAQQSFILAGLVMPPRALEDAEAYEAMETALGGKFTSRLNLNLREDKHWSYGVSAVTLDTANQRPYLLFAPVQTDKTAAAMREIHKEISEFVGERPLEEEELQDFVSDETLKQSARFQTKGQLLSSIAWQLRHGLPADYIAKYPERLAELTLEAGRSAAGKYLAPDRFVWVVVGDLEKVHEDIEALELGEVRLLERLP